MQTLRASLVAMERHVQGHVVKRLVMPKIACDLDRLSWTAVRPLILEVFAGVEIKMVMRTLAQVPFLQRSLEWV